MFTPSAMPVTVVAGLVASAKVPAPLTTVQEPLAGAVGALAARVTLATGAQKLWSGPALAAGALRSNTRITTWSLAVGGMHGPLLTVQRSVCVPTARLVTVVVGLAGAVMTAPAGPLTMDQLPVAGRATADAASVAEAKELPVAVQTSWSGPAFGAGNAGSKRVMVTCELVTPLAQGPLLKVHRNTLAPNESPLTPVVGLVASVKVPVPLTTLQTPEAGARGALPANVVELLHTDWLGPAFAAGLAGLNTTMLTSSCVVGGTQGPLLMVQRKVFTPMPNPLTAVLGLLALAKVPVPATTVHEPVAGAIGAFPASVAELDGAQSCWSGPAFAVGCALLNTNTVTWSLVGAPQGPLVIVQRNTFAPTLRPLTAVVGLAASAKVPVPLTSTHAPLAGAGALLAASVVPVLGRQML